MVADGSGSCCSRAYLVNVVEGMYTATGACQQGYVGGGFEEQKGQCFRAYGMSWYLGVSHFV